VRPDALGLVGVFLLYVIRGYALWLLVPIGALVWLVTFQWVGVKRCSAGAFLGWLDNNLSFALVCGPLSPFFPTARVMWIPASERFGVTHRIGKFFDTTGGR
jgi:hypothetical protein